MDDTTTATPPLAPRIEHIRRLAEIIWEVLIWEVRDSYDIESAALLAEAILAHPGFSGCHDGPPPAHAGLSYTCDPAKDIGPHAEDLATDGQMLEPSDLYGGETDCRPAAPPAQEEAEEPVGALPPGYIDPEHQGEDRKLLEAFYRAARLIGGTADEIVLRGIRSVLALRPTVAAVRAADAAISDEALEAEFRAWWKVQVHPLNAPRYHAVTTHIAWGRHLLTRGQP